MQDTSQTEAVTVNTRPSTVMTSPTILARSNATAGVRHWSHPLEVGQLGGVRGDEHDGVGAQVVMEVAQLVQEYHSLSYLQCATF